MADSIIERIERFPCHRGRLLAERRNRGYTLTHAASGAPVARLRPTGREDRVEVLYWSLWKERWVPFGLFGGPPATIDQALRVIANASVFGVSR